MDFVFLLCERGWWGCIMVLYVDLLFNRREGMLCGCGSVSGCRFFLYVDLFFNFSVVALNESQKMLKTTFKGR